MKRLPPVPTLLLPTLLLPLALTAQRHSEPVIAQAARIERSPSGVLVMRGSRRADPAPPQASATPAGESSEAPAAAAQKPETSTQTLARMLGESGDVRYLSARKAPPKASGTTESVVQQFNSAGEATIQDVIRATTRILADGTIETIETVTTSDINGRPRVSRRTTIREKSSGASTKTTTTVERRGAGGRFRVEEKSESVAKTSADGSSGSIDTVLYKNPGMGEGVVESGRERTVMTIDSRGVRSETTIYQRSTVTGRTELSGRKVGRLSRRDDGSLNETIEVYGRLGSTQQAGPIRLQRVVKRSVSIGRDGSVNEVTTAAGRGALAGQSAKTQRVSRLTDDGRVETAVYQQAADGHMFATETVVEPLAK